MPDINTEFMIQPGRGNYGYPMKARFVTIHNTPGTTARNLASWITQDGPASEPRSWHFSVDASSIYQSLPLNVCGWHAGDGRYGTGNRETVGIEICYGNGGEWFQQAVDRAADLTGWQLDQLALTASDIRKHQDWSGKYCPMYLLNGEAGGWTGFLKAATEAYKRYHTDERYFPETQLWVHEEFWPLYQEGGVPLFGYPISPATGDLAVCRQFGPTVVMVQWTERARFEKHINSEGESLVMLGRVGAELRDALEAA